MIKKLKYYAKEILLFIVIITIAANLISFYKSSSLNKDVFFLPNIKLLNSSTFILDKNKPILVHIWATWCPTCKLEASNIQTVSKGFQVLTIAVKSGSDKELQKYLDDNNYDFNVINDINGYISSEFKIGVFPTTIIYNKEQEVIFSDVGYTSTVGLYLRMWWASL